MSTDTVVGNVGYLSVQEMSTEYTFSPCISFSGFTESKCAPGVLQMGVLEMFLTKLLKNGKNTLQAFKGIKMSID